MGAEPPVFGASRTLRLRLWLIIEDEDNWNQTYFDWFLVVLNAAACLAGGVVLVFAVRARGLEGHDFVRPL